MDKPTIDGQTNQSARQLTVLIYAQHAGGILTGGLTALVAIIMIYLKKDEVAGTYLESHFSWQKRTFWLGALGIIGGSIVAGIIGALAASFGIWMDNFLGKIVIFFAVLVWIVPFAVAVWWIYRLVKGYLRLNNNQPA